MVRLTLWVFGIESSTLQYTPHKVERTCQNLKASLCFCSDPNFIFTILILGFKHGNEVCYFHFLRCVLALAHLHCHKLLGESLLAGEV